MSWQRTFIRLRCRQDGAVLLLDLFDICLNFFDIFSYFHDLQRGETKKLAK